VGLEVTMKTRWLLAMCLLGLLGGLATGCGDDESMDDGQAGSGGDGDGDADAEAAADTFEQQVARGGEAYGEYCAKCHGAMGEGNSMAPPLTAGGDPSNAPALVGDGALPREPPAERLYRTAEFRTALDVYEFASVTMPGDDPGSLDAATYVDILAFALSANGVELDTPLDADVAADLVINPP
jgi:cytochrome c